MSQLPTLSSEPYSSCQEPAKARLGLPSLACPGFIHMCLAEMKPYGAREVNKELRQGDAGLGLLSL